MKLTKILFPVILVLCLILGIHPISALELPSRATVVGGVAIPVADLDRAVDFYTHVLAFKKVSETEVAGEDYERLEGLFGLRLRVALLQLGNEHLILQEFLTPEGRPIPVDSKSNDLWFQHIAIVVSDMDQAYGWLRQHHVRYASPSPQRLPDWNKNAGGIKAFYFKDPDRHTLEIIWFPAGKGDPKWQKKTDDLFLGIDHTAIVVKSTAKSEAFYRDHLGLHVLGESDNYGPEQERLNNVAGAHLHITGLRGESGPGVEFLEYLTPPTGHPYPEDTQTNDLWNWQTVMAVPQATSSYADLEKAGALMVSQGVAALPQAEMGFKKGFEARDPDRHAILVVEP